MAETILEEDVRRATAQVEHPEIARTLVDLGMIKNVAFKCDKATITLPLPFLGVPIRGYLVGLLREAVKELDVEAEVRVMEMSQEKRAAFIRMAREFWRG